MNARLTWGQRLLELLGLFSIVQHERVEESGTSNLELGSDGGFGRFSLGRGVGLVVLDCRLLDSGDCGVGTIVERSEVIIKVGRDWRATRQRE